MPMYEVIVRLFGPDSSLLEPTSWQGIQKIAEWYLDSSVGWTLLFVPMAILWVLFSFSEHLTEQRRAAKLAEKENARQQNDASGA